MCKAVLWFCTVFCLSTVSAIELFQFSVAKSEWQQGLLQQLQLSLSFNDNGLGLSGHAEQLVLAEPIGELNNVELTCQNVVVQQDRLNCDRGQLSFHHALFGQQTLSFKLQTQHEEALLQFEVSGLTMGDGVINASFQQHGHHWRITAKSTQLSIAALLKQFHAPLSGVGEMALPEQLSGEIQSHWTIEGSQTGIESIATTLSMQDVDIVSQEAQIEAQAIQAKWSFNIKRKQHRWQWQMNGAIEQGQSYREPIFIDFADTPIRLDAVGLWHDDKQTWRVEQANMTQQGVVTATMSSTGIFDEIQQANITLERSQLPLLYQHWIQPFLIYKTIGNIDLSGEIDLNYQYENNVSQWQFGLTNVDVVDEAQRFALYGLQGQLAWTAFSQALPINISWSHGSILSIPIGNSHVTGSSQSSQFTLQDAWQMPILDGDLKIHHLLLSQEDTELSWAFEGIISPISMTLLSEHLGWPKMHGKLSGVIPKVTYQDHQVTVDGALMVKLFNGTSVIHHLSLLDPLGAIPQLYADIDLQNFDLETMTNTFDFGTMTGTVSGKVNQLRLANWQPVAFDAYLETSENDDVPHKISQQAVNNLSSLGGGATGALSRSFLRFFENFSYDKLGISCKLQNDICQMSGVEPAEQGYYIVKGGGFPPTIDVIGHTSKVDWPELLDRLKAVSNSSGPVIQ